MAEPSTLARPYARAAFDYALENKDLAGWSQQLRLLATLITEERVDSALSRPSISSSEQAKLVLGLAGDALAGPVQNFLHILAENRRLPLLPEVQQQFERLRAEQEKSVDVEVATAYPLGEALMERLTSALGQSLQREVSLNAVVDPSLLGGIVVRAGDLVVDGSVRGRLAQLAGAMNS